MKTIIGALALVVGVALALPAAAQTRGSDDAGFYRTEYQIISRMNGLCLDVDGRMAPGARLVMMNCNGRHTQRFYPQPVSGDGRIDGDMRLVAGGSGGDLCLEAPTGHGEPLRLQTCSDRTGVQTWRFQARNVRPLISATGLCANIEGENQSERARLISWRCVGAINEGWIFNPVS